MKKIQSAGGSGRARRPWRLRLLRLVFATTGALYPALAARGAHHLWYRPRRDTLSAKEFAELGRAVCVPLTYAGRPVAGYLWGQGPLVLLVHGWSGRAAQLGGFVAPLVEAGYQVLAFDAPAHGRSAGRSTTLPEIADVIAQLVQRHGPLHGIIAHSFGVLCALYAASRGAAPRRFVGISAPATVDGLVANFADKLALPRRAVERLRRLLEQRFGANLWSEFAATHMVRRLALPGLIIHDRYDREVAWHDGAAIAESWPGGSVLVTEGLGHQRLLRDPQVIKAAVQFISAVT